MYSILENINKPNDIKNIDAKDYKKLATEIRACLLKNVSKTGGHLASNLGIVEITMALHLCSNLPEDKIIWDVGHQSYVHKILTGRWRELGTLRQYDGLSGFPQMKESDTDAFDTGHATTSVSAALGYAHAYSIQNMDNKVFAVIGDGSLTGGMFYEALNNAATLKSNMVIVLNDNNMSIANNVGGMSRYLTKLRTASQYKNLKDNIEEALKKMPYIGDQVIEKIRRSKSSLKHLVIPGMLFEDMGLTYIGPVDGHNVNELVSTFKHALNLNKPVIVHVRTVKGKGYKFAEKYPSKFHGIDPFNIKTGELKKSKDESVRSYTDVFGNKMCSMAKENDRLVAVCAAMPHGTGLIDFSKQFKDRFFDVGIAEEHAVTFAAGLAAGGMVPVVAIYSTFLQRSYDQIIHDVCKCGHHVVFAVDRAGIVGNDGETHQGIYDISFLTSIPRLTVMAPKDGNELEAMLDYAVNECDSPVAIRYPRGSVVDMDNVNSCNIKMGKCEIIHEDAMAEAVFLALGSMVNVAKKAADELSREGIKTTLVNLRFAKPLDMDGIDRIIADNKAANKLLVILEENTENGGVAEKIAAHVNYMDENIRCLGINLPDAYIEHGNQNFLREKYGLSENEIVNRVRSMIQ